MLIYLTQGIAETNSAATTIISIAVMLFLGFATTRLTEPLRLPNVTAYILAGILIGPYCLNLIPTSVIAGTDFLSDIALAFIAFSTGEFFTISALKKNGLKVVLITIMEACLATVFVFIVTYCILGIDLVFSIVLSALASATAPASTVMTIRQTGAHGCPCRHHGFIPSGSHQYCQTHCDQHCRPTSWRSVWRIFKALDATKAVQG